MSEYNTVETKAADLRSGDMLDAFDGFMRAFDSFKEANDQRLGEIEKKLDADVVTTEKVDRINAALDRQMKRMDEMAAKGQRPRLEGASAPLSAEHKAAFEAYVRRGEAGNIARLEEKALGERAPDGGYNVPVEIDYTINQRLATLSPIRGIASVRQISKTSYKKPYVVGGLTAGWVPSSSVIGATTATPTLAALDFPTMELYAQPAATTGLLDDPAVNLEAWLAAEVEHVFAEQETEAFVTGNGTDKPKGFTAYDTVADSAWEWGKIGTVVSGGAAGFAATNPSDRLLDLIYALKAGYRQNGSFVMNRKTQAEVRKFKSTDGQYLWQPPAQPGGQAMLASFPVVEAEAMPDIAANATPIAFGDFRRGYLVIDRTGVQILRDPFSAKPYVLFYTTKRVGGGVQDFAAIKLLKIAAS